MDDALVPYGETRIVLRHNDSVVLYDANSRRVVARNASDDPDAQAVDFSKCRECGRPYNYANLEDDRHASRDASTMAAGRGEASPEYFRMLAGSLPNAPSSPVRQLAQPPASSLPTAGSTEFPLAGGQAPTVGEVNVAYNPENGAQASAAIDPSAFSQGYFNRFFQDSSELGRGGKGVVLLAKHVIDRVDLGWYAIKRIPVGNDHQWLMKILTEVQLLSKLHHDNLVQYKHVWLEEVTITTFGPSVACAFVCQEYCNAGDLHRFICGGGRRGTVASKEEMKEQHRRKNSKVSESISEASKGLRRLSLDEIYSFFKQITAGVNYLHEKLYVHRDLKPSNCLLHDTGQELKVLVSDFGEVQTSDQVREGTGSTGTISYCAPEVLKLDPHSGSLGAFTPKSDVFSLGMVLHFLCFGQLPYRSADGIEEEDEDVEQLKDEISRWAGFEEERHLRSDLPDILYQNLSRLLSTNPGHRPSTSEILAGLESRGISGRISGSKAGGILGKNGQGMRVRTGQSPFDRRRTSRVGGGGGGSSSMERNRSKDSTGAMSTSTSLTQSNASLRRHVSPPKLTREKTSASGETAVATEPDSDSSLENMNASSSSFRRDSIILHPTSSSFSSSRPVSRANSPLKDGPFSPPPQPQHQQHHQRRPRLLTASGELEEDNDEDEDEGSRSSWWRQLLGLGAGGSDSVNVPMPSNTAQLARVVLLLAKLLSLYMPCLPAAANPRVALALLALALADFVGSPLQRSSWLGGGLLLLLLHVLVLAGSGFVGVEMCLGDGSVGDSWVQGYSLPGWADYYYSYYRRGRDWS